MKSAIFGCNFRLGNTLEEIAEAGLEPADTSFKVTYFYQQKLLRISCLLLNSLEAAETSSANRSQTNRFGFQEECLPLFRSFQSLSNEFVVPHLCVLITRLSN